MAHPRTFVPVRRGPSPCRSCSNVRGCAPTSAKFRFPIGSTRRAARERALSAVGRFRKFIAIRKRVGLSDSVSLAPPYGRIETVHLRPRFLLLDCDGVLVNSETLAEQAELAVLSTLGVVLPPADYREITLGLSEGRHLALLEERLDREKVAIPSADLKARLHSARWDRYETDLSLIEGIAELLEQYRHNVAIVSSSDQESVARKLDLVGASDVVPANRIFGTEVGAPIKTTTYAVALSRLGVSSVDCLAVEDSAEGVRAAREVGVPVWGFTGGAPVDESRAKALAGAGASEVFASVDALRTAIDRAFESGLPPQPV